MIQPFNTFAQFWPGIFPVIQRELRGNARRPANYWMRVAAGAGASVVLFYGVILLPPSPAELGASLFMYLHLTMVVVLALFVPPLTADCIAREKREGTLGLLFLTPLTPMGIVAGKSLSMALRALCLWLAALPVFAVPFCLGGLTWSHVALSASFEFSTAVICIASGLLASSFTEKWGAAVIMAGLFAVSAVCILPMVSFWALQAVQQLIVPPANQGVIVGHDFGLGIENIAYAIVLESGAPFYNNLLGVVVPPQSIFIRMGAMIGAALLFGLAAFWIAAWRIRVSWQAKPPTQRQLRWKTFLNRDLTRGWLRGRLRRTMEANPIAWLQQYSVGARIEKWLFCLLITVLITFFSMSASSGFENMYTAESLLLWLLAIIYTRAGVASFMEEKRSGALELILITPITPRRIIFGRAIGLWKRFLPSALLLLVFGALVYFNDPERRMGNYYSYSHRNLEAGSIFIYAILYLSLPFYTTYAALRVRWTLLGMAVSWLGPLLAMALAEHLRGILFGYMIANSYDSVYQFFYAIFFALTSVGSVGLTFFLLNHSLSRRIYSF